MEELVGKTPWDAVEDHTPPKKGLHPHASLRILTSSRVQENFFIIIIIINS